MDKNALPTNKRYAKLNVREEFIESIKRLNQLQTDINRANGIIAKEVQKTSPTVAAKIQANVKAVSSANREAKEVAARCAEQIQVLINLD